MFNITSILNILYLIDINKYIVCIDSHYFQNIKQYIIETILEYFV